MESLLGDTLVSKEGNISTSSLDSKVVGLCFSIPQYKEFNMKLVDFYFIAKEKGLSFEIIFISLDSGENSFEEFIDEMPWLGVKTSFNARYLAFGKLQVRDIPSLVFCDGETGAVTNRKGRGLIMGDPDGAWLPWLPVPLKKYIEGKLVDKSGAEFDYASTAAHKIKGLFFAAQWCWYSREFLPKLAKFYEAVTAAGHDFEIIYCSRDNYEFPYKEFLNEMPWKALPFGDPRSKQLDTIYEITGYPNLILLDENDKIITENGRRAVSSDPEGKEFPRYQRFGSGEF